MRKMPRVMIYDGKDQLLSPLENGTTFYNPFAVLFSNEKEGVFSKREKVFSAFIFYQVLVGYLVNSNGMAWHV